MKQYIMNKRNLYFATTLFIAIVVGFFGGIIDIMQTDVVVSVAKELGYPLYFFTLLGVFKVLGALILLLPRKFIRIRDMAYLGFTFDFIFAAYSNDMATGNVFQTLIPIVMLVILCISYYLKDKF